MVLYSDLIAGRVYTRNQQQGSVPEKYKFNEKDRIVTQEKSFKEEIIGPLPGMKHE